MATTTPSLSGITEQYKLPETQKAGNSNMGKEDFLKLLIAQLQNQDPTSPMDNSQMIAQMATLSQMESISAMATSVQQSQTYNMIGKGVTGYIVNNDTGVRTSVVGTVDSAGIESGKPYVMVGDIKVYAENITQVFDRSIITGSSDAVMAATAMVGRYARANIGTAAKPEYVEGQVSRWWSDKGDVYITLDGLDVPLNQVITVADALSSLGSAPSGNQNGGQSEEQTEG